MDRLAGKGALITGGSSGIGLAVAAAFLQEGAKVAVVGRDAAKLRQAVTQLGALDRLTSYRADIADPTQVEKLFRRLADDGQSVDILVNNAGLNIKERAVRQLTPEKWQLILRANLDGAYYCIHAVLPQMLARRDGVIINLNSIAGKRPGPLGGAAYAASKFGMRALGFCLAAEEKESGIRVSNIYPGEVDTPILDDRPEPPSAEQRQRMLRPKDVAAAVLFVATQPARVSIPELMIKPTSQFYV